MFNFQTLDKIINNSRKGTYQDVPSHAAGLTQMWKLADKKYWINSKWEYWIDKVTLSLNRITFMVNITFLSYSENCFNGKNTMTWFYADQFFFFFGLELFQTRIKLSFKTESTNTIYFCFIHFKLLKVTESVGH